MASVKKGDPSFLIETYTLAQPLIRDILGTIYDIARFKEYDIDDFDRVAREIRGDFSDIKWRVQEQLNTYHL